MGSRSHLPLLARPCQRCARARRGTVLFAVLAGLRNDRNWLDGLIVEMAGALPDEALARSLTYANTKGVESTRNLMALLLHFFNHQTHHRGQVTTLLFQAGIDPGTTDLLALI